MKMTFKQFLFEYENKQMPNPLSIDQLESFLEFETINQTINLEENIQLVFYKLSSKYISIVIKLDNNIIGYLMMNIFEDTKYWQVSSVFIYDTHSRGKGIGSLTYEKLLDLGYTLLNGTTLSNEAERLWKKLIHKFYSGTFDKIENKIYELDDRPTNDKANSDSLGTDQRYFWIISKGKLI